MNGPFGYFQYHDDAENIWRVRLRRTTALAAGFVEDFSDNVRQPRGLQLRFHYGVSPLDGNVKILHMPRAYSTAWTNAGAFIVDGRLYRIVYSKGERWTRFL